MLSIKQKCLIKRIITIWGVLLIALPFLVGIKAETDNTFRGYWMAWEEVQEGYMYNSYVTTQNAIIVTNDPTAIGYTVVTNDSFGTDPFTRNLRFAGTYTSYSNLDAQEFTANAYPNPMHYRYGQFTSTEVYQGDLDNPEQVSLSASSITALANAISLSVGGYDDTQLLQTLDAINLLIANIDTSITGISSAITSLNSVVSNIYQLLGNIDNAIDTITWNNLYSGVFSYADTYDGNYVNTTNSTIGKDIYFDSQLTTEAKRYPSIVKYTLPLDGSGISNNSYFIDNIDLVRVSDGVIRSTITNWVAIYNRTAITLFIYNFRAFDNNDVVRLHLHFENAVRSYRNTLRVDYIDSNDIEYWQLLSYLEQHRYYQQEYPELDQPNQDLEVAVDDYIQQEDDLIDDFNNAIEDPGVDPSNTDSNPSNWGNSFISSLSFIGYIFNELTGATSGGNPFYLMINMSLMLGMALLIIGKRAI